MSSGACAGFTLFMMLVESFLKGRCDIATPCQRLESIPHTDDEYDFIVVGAGAAGSIVAARLSEVDKFQVLLLEAGIEEPIGARVPSFYMTFLDNPAMDWRYRTQLGDFCHDQGVKGCQWPRGKVVGGSNTLNGMMYVRGHKADYEDWVAAGATGWSWEQNQEYFAMTEGNKQIGSLVSGTTTLAKDLCLFNDNGQRYTTARSFLKPKSERPNLHLMTRAHVSRVLINATRHAYGVEYIDKDGNTRTVRARKEVILSAGALNTPHILLLSGVGPKPTLDKFNISLISDLPVGLTLKNHNGMILPFIVTEDNYTQQLNWAVLTEYLLERDGPMSGTGITQLSGLLYSSLADKNRSQPDLQFFFNGYYADCSKSGAIDEPVGSGDCYLKGRNISVSAVLLLPRSVGHLTLNSTDPRDPPLFYPEFFTHPDDMVMMKDAARYVQRIFDSDIMKKKWGVELNRDVAEVCTSKSQEWSDAWIECMARTYTDPQNHQLGTAAIGTVLDTQLKVINVKGLRVMDASSMPTPPTGNPQAAIMMVAERGAALLKEAWA